MKILRRLSRTSAKKLNLFTQSDAYHLIDLKELYPDPKLSSVYIKKACRIMMLEFIQQSTLENPVPEVGGFLLGNYVQDAEGYYQSSVEVFVPSHQVEFNSPSLLDFGTNAMIEWNQAQENHPELGTIGWFHTHPGHSPYLSNTDMNMHEGFFSLPYQLAIVVDPLTEDWDTGVFCRSTDGSMSRYLPHTNFLSWLDMIEA